VAINTDPYFCYYNRCPCCGGIKQSTPYQVTSNTSTEEYVEKYNDIVKKAKEKDVD
jgi:hypothetical protein